jgi:hypothetical protein
MWSKVIKKRRKVNGLKKERLERSDPLETSTLSLLFIARFPFNICVPCFDYCVTKFFVIRVLHVLHTL